MNIRLYEPKDVKATVELWYRTWHKTFPEIQHPQPYLEWEIRFRDDLAVKTLAVS